jgi:hypothetical protein
MKFPADALDAFLEGLLTELKSPADPETLGQIRAAFRRRIPFLMRSNAAAMLIMRAAGLSRGVSARIQPESVTAPIPPKSAEPVVRNQRKPVLSGDPSTRPVPKTASRSAPRGQGSSDEAEGNQRPPLTPQPAAKKPAKDNQAKPRPVRQEQERPRPPKPEKAASEAPETQPNPASAAKPRQTSYALSVPSTPLFVSMGRRQRLRATEVRDLFMEKGGLGAEDVGQVRLFDNYCFIDIASEKAQKATDAVNGAELRGRPITVVPAKPRGEMFRDSSSQQEALPEGVETEDLAPETGVEASEGGQESQA